MMRYKCSNPSCGNITEFEKPPILPVVFCDVCGWHMNPEVPIVREMSWHRKEREREQEANREEAMLSVSRKESSPKTQKPQE